MNRRQLTLFWIMIAAAAILVIGVFSMLYRSSQENILRVWQSRTIQLATEVNDYLAMPQDAVLISGQKLNDMLARDASLEEALDYLRSETEIYAPIIRDNITGVYGYYKGAYLDGSGWDPPEDYDATKRPWYLGAVEAQGKLALIKPYLNVQTFEMTMSISQLLNDGESVVSMDVFLDGVQQIVEESVGEANLDAVFIIDRSGFVVAHSDAGSVGKEYLQEGTLYEKALYQKVYSGESGARIRGAEHTSLVLSAPVNGDWYAVMLLNEQGTFLSLRYIYFISAVVLAFTISVILIFFLYLRRKHLETERLNREIQAVADIYEDVFHVDFKADEMTDLHRGEADWISLEEEPVVFSQMVVRLFGEMSSDRSRDLLKAFLDPDTLSRRLKGINTITHEFVDIYDRWLRLRFIVVDRDAEGAPWHALLAVESIDEDRKRQESLKRLSETDLMTGVLNRGSGEAKVKERMAEGVQGMFIVLDVDRFKSINDVFGHSVGDKAIIALADGIKAAFRESDLVFRLGGDEFAVFAADVLDRETGTAVIERLFRRLEGIHIAEMGGKQFTVSAGAAFYRAGTDDSFEALYERADAGCYQSKTREGNFVSFQDEGSDEPPAGTEQDVQDSI